MANISKIQKTLYTHIPKIDTSIPYPFKYLHNIPYPFKFLANILVSLKPFSLYRSRGHMLDFPTLMMDFSPWGLFLILADSAYPDALAFFDISPLP